MDILIGILCLLLIVGLMWLVFEDAPDNVNHW